MSECRVMSLLPSSTEMLVLCMNAQPRGEKGQVVLVGRDHESDYPANAVANVPVVTSAKITNFDHNTTAETATTGVDSAKEIDAKVKELVESGASLYNIDEGLVAELKPDVVLTQSLCDVCSIDLKTVQRTIRSLGRGDQVRIVDMNPKSLDEVMENILDVGEAIGCRRGAQDVVDGLRLRIREACARGKQIAMKKRPVVAFFEWTSPVFCGGHWTPEMIEMAGGLHPLRRAGEKSVAVSDADVSAIDADVVVVAPCGITIAKGMELLRELEQSERGEWFRSLRAYREGRVVVVDGNDYFNRPGPRLVEALEFLVSLFACLVEADEESGGGGEKKKKRLTTIKAEGRVVGGAVEWQPYC